MLLQPAVAASESLREIAAGLVLDAGQISVSGISSGAYMAQQMHVAHSRHVMGAGLVAGGPYGCAAGSYPPYTWFDYTGLYAATSRCSNTNPMWFYQGPPDAGFSIAEARRADDRGSIDPVEGLRGDRVWLFSGAQDETVPRGVVEALETFYAAFEDRGDIHHEKLDAAGHAMITEDFGNACGVSASPFISDCDFDAAGALLAHIHGPLEPHAASVDPTAVREFEQIEYFDPGDERIGLHEFGHVYVPDACVRGEICRLHIVFHGCQQSQSLIGDAFYARAGYNPWAETNRMVILYPQAAAWQGNAWLGSGNPKGCWDWWGYSGADYNTRSGSQMRAVVAMADALIGRALFTAKPTGGD